MTTVMVFGTFDIIHNGHKFFLDKARSLGDEMIIVVARDSTVERIKGKAPYNDENSRKKALESLHFEKLVVLGSDKDHLEVVWRYMPDIICLGYDQDSRGIEEEIKRRGLPIKVVRLGSHKPERFKSTLLKKRLNL